MAKIATDQYGRPAESEGSLYIGDVYDFELSGLDATHFNNWLVYFSLNGETFRGWVVDPFGSDEDDVEIDVDAQIIDAERI